MRTTDFLQLALNATVEGYEIGNLSKDDRKNKRAEKKASKADEKAEKKEKRGEKLEKFGNKIKGAVAKFGAIGVLIPFKGIMSKRLQKDGVAVPEKLDDIAVLFFDRYIKKDKKESYEVGNFIPPQLVAGIVQGVIAFFKNLIDRKKNGEKLTPAEEEMANKAVQVDEEITKATNDITEETIGEYFIKYLPYILIGGVVLYFVLKK